MLMILRETGVIKIFLATAKSDSQMDGGTIALPNLEVTKVTYVCDTGRPFLPKNAAPDDGYRCTICYQIHSTLSPWRWLPIFKFGKNEAQLTYFVWLGGSPAGCGAVTLQGSMSMIGIASARDYEKSFTEPLMQQMKRDLEPKLKIFHR